MQPVTIKSHKLIDGLWFSQILLAVVIVAAWFLLPWPWPLLTVLLTLMMLVNHRQIIKHQTYSVSVNTQLQWFQVVADKLYPCRMSGYWHSGQSLWIRLKSEWGVQYCLIRKTRVGGTRYAQLLMAVTQDEQQAK